MLHLKNLSHIIHYLTAVYELFSLYLCAPGHSSRYAFELMSFIRLIHQFWGGAIFNMYKYIE